MNDRSSGTRPEDARRRAEERFQKIKRREDDVKKALTHLDKMQKAEAEKTARLRALRLAKEAADKQAADIKAAEKAALIEAKAAKAAARRNTSGSE